MSATSPVLSDLCVVVVLLLRGPVPTCRARLAVRWSEARSEEEVPDVLAESRDEDDCEARRLVISGCITWPVERGEVFSERRGSQCAERKNGGAQSWIGSSTHSMSERTSSHIDFVYS